MQAEARYYLVAVLAIVALVFLSFVIWGIFRERIMADSTSTVAVIFFVGQILGVLVFILTSVVGYKPGVVIRVSSQVIEIEQGEDYVRIPARDVTGVETVDDVVFHRHYRRFAQLREFSGRSPDAYLLLRTDETVIGLGIGTHERAEVLNALSAGRQSEAATLAPAAR